jgi:DNA-binding CsgD family transcriptional regulator
LIQNRSVSTLSLVPARTSSSLLAVVHAAYEPKASTDEWLQSVALAARPALDRGFGLMTMTFRIGDGRLVPTSELVTVGDVPAPIAGVATALQERNMLDEVPCARALYPSWAEPRALDSASAAYARTHPERRFSELPVLAFARQFGIFDQVVAKAVDPCGNGYLLWAGSPDETTILAHHARRWSRVMTHLLAALRLRTTLAVREEAVLEPGGRVVHAEGVARARPLREALREAAVQLDRARSRTGASDPDTALSGWRGLVAGRWSLVDSFERDGRRYLVARRNDPTLAQPMELTQRERQILAYAALGHPNKCIAYALGLAPSTVSSHLVSGMRRLGLENRAELARVWSFEEASRIAALEGHEGS